jgi:hypothetical protein
MHFKLIVIKEMLFAKITIRMEKHHIAELVNIASLQMFV